MPSDTIAESAKVLRDRVLQQRHYGSLEIVDAAVSVDVDVNREMAVFLDLTVPVPEGAETWPVQEAFALREAVDRQAREVGLEWPWYVRLHPAGDDEEYDE